jgi:hypothetical protein
MAQAQRGKAVFWGIGSSFVYSGTGIVLTTAVHNPQNVDHSVDSQKADIADYKGEKVARIYFDEEETMTIQVIPTADTIAAAKATSVMPSPGAIVTVVDTDDTEAAGSAGSSNAWILDRASKRRSNKGPLEMTFELYRSAVNNLGVQPS